jgi:hypothetical protein
MTADTAELLTYCRLNNRVFPQPQRWLALWEMLPNRKQIGSRSEPPLPLILAWYDTPAILKMARLAEHIEWATAHGALPQVESFLQSLKEEDWHHLDE